MPTDARPVGFAALSAVALIPLAGGCSFIRWESSLESGLAKAAQGQRPALVQFYSALNGDCLEMERQVFTDSEVQQQLEGFVPIRLDCQLNRKLAEQMGVERLPTFFVLRCDGTIAGSHAGKMAADKFNFFLIKYRYY